MNWLVRLIKPDAAPAIEAKAETTVAGHIRNGNALLGQGRPHDAAEHYRQAVQAHGLSADAHVNLGFALIEAGRPEEALAPLRQAVVLAPESQDAHYLLGTLLQAKLEFAAAIKHFETAIELKPDLLVAYRDLGKALHDTGQHDRARSVLQAGLVVDARSADLHFYLGNVELHQMKLDEALASYRRALAIQPDYAVVHSNMVQALLNLCDFDQAAVAARRALELDPSMHFARSNLLMTMSCDVRYSPHEYLDEARRYGEVLMARAAPRGETQRVDTADTERRLRIGFVSGDFHNHPVGFFLENVLAHWNSGQEMDAFAYSNHPAVDDLTLRLKARFSRWRDIWGVSDEEVARHIASDRIDVLVDLSGHTPENRLPLFARRPAPVQVSWLGYWASTGLTTMDYLLADPISVPPEHRAHFTESVWWLPDTRLCFTPPVGPGVPKVSPPPALQAGHITFGSFQRLTKLNDSVLRLWARVLHAVPGARLRLQSTQMKDPSACSNLLQRLATAGIDTARVQLAQPGTRLEYLAAHAEVDLLLDTFPHNGATTTCEALWMGVPTLTLAGGTMLARQGASLLECAGLGQWVATDEDDYVARAVRHAGDLPALEHLRSGLREQVAASPLFDAARFAAQLQESLRCMWRRKACGLSVEIAGSADSHKAASMSRPA
jgi:protein O-GlcNAc transferase